MFESLVWTLVASVTPAPALPPSYAFITNATGTPNLSTWTEAGGMSGLAAGDNICRTEATAANLTDAGDYIAFMSDSHDDLYCRVHGLPGKVSNNCGQASLPASAGPWLRMDGIPFATLQTFITDNTAIAPVLYTRDKINQVSTAAMTGTWPGMVFNGFGACADWTAESSDTMYIASAGSINVFGSSTGCSGTRPLICLRAGSSIALNYARQSGRDSFITTGTGNGKLSTWANAGGASGVAAGDKVCQAEAAADGLKAPTSFKAWLSDDANGIAAINRFQNDGPWRRLDGVPVATSKASLVAPGTSKIMSVPTLDVPLQSGDSILTGTLNSGMADATHECKSWTSQSSSDSALTGFGQLINIWSDFTTVSDCSGTTYRLYCFSDLDRIFDGSMESIPY